MTDTQSAYPDILISLLRHFQWKGNNRQLAEAIPHHEGAMDLQAMRDALSHLGFPSILCEVKPEDYRKNIFPVLYIGRDGLPGIVASREELAQLPGAACQIVEFTRADATGMAAPGVSVLRQQMQRFKPLLNEIVVISLIIGGVSLAPILYNRSIYDHIIASGSSSGFAMMLAGVLAALGVEIALRTLRNRRLAFFGGRLDHYVSCSVFERLLFLPPVYTERSSVSSQLARLRDFESVREFFTGPLSSLFFELPLILVYLAAMGLIAGPLAFVPVAVICAYLLLMANMQGRLRHYSRIAANAATKRQEFLLETVTKLRAIRAAGLDRAWFNRYRLLSGQASLASFKSAYSAQMLESLSYALMVGGGAATLCFGVMMVISGSLTVGTLVAAMMLIWRIITPLQICCASLTRIQQLGSSAKQVERLLSAPPEHDPNLPFGQIDRIKGALGFHRVSLRYSAETEPALLGVSFDIRPGQIIAIRGNNGSGKSTVLKLVLGLYQPQSGSVRLDGMDIRQFDPLSLRQKIAYVPQDGDFFPGSLRDNLLFSNPGAGEDDIIQALGEACALEDVAALPQGLDTHVEVDSHAVVSFALRQKLNLARAYLRDASIYLFDEASYSLGPDNDRAFEEKIRSLRGRATVLMATHREDHMRLADQLLCMNKGELTHAGPPDQVLTVLKGRRA